ncbi:MAG TPA: recombinase family protein [Sediminibacterium sp.]
MNEKKQVGIWIRVSTDMQVKDESPEHHEKRARYYAESRNWEVVTVYRLDAISGKTVIAQPEAKRMLTDIRSGRITGLIFSKLARLARNTKELLEFADIFREYNADLISLAEAIDTSTPAGRLFFTIIAAMAQWEREEISSRVAASVPIRAQLGKPLGGAAPFGYRWENKELQIDETEAPVRVLMFETFRTVRRIQTTANLLNEKGYRTRNGEKFSDNTVNRLLRDPMAKGERRANYTKSPGKGKQWQYKPVDEWIIIPCPAIVSAELWEECNAILTEQERKREKTGRKAAILLSGYVFCHCNSKMGTRLSHRNYICPTCKNRIAADTLDHIFHEQLKGRIASLNPDKYREEKDHELVEAERLYTVTAMERDKLAKRRTNLVSMRADGDLDKAAFTEEYKPLEARLAQLDDELPALEAAMAYARIQRQSAETVLDDAKTLYEQWGDLPFEQKRGIIETIVRHISIGTDTVEIAFDYAPAFSGNGTDYLHNHMDSSKRSA